MARNLMPCATLLTIPTTCILYVPKEYLQSYFTQWHRNAFGSQQ